MPATLVLLDGAVVDVVVVLVDVVVVVVVGIGGSTGGNSGCGLQTLPASGRPGAGSTGGSMNPGCAKSKESSRSSALASR